MVISSQFSTGQLAATTSAAQLSTSATNFSAGVKLTCLSSSTASIFIGNSLVTTSTGDEIPPGTAYILPIPDISTLWIVSSASNAATLSWIGLV